MRDKTVGRPIYFFGCHLGNPHNWIGVEEVDHSMCGQCFKMPGQMSEELAAKYPKGYCPHSFKVCVKCGQAVGYGSHGRLSLVPDGCKKQIERMKLYGCEENNGSI